MIPAKAEVHAPLKANSLAAAHLDVGDNLVRHFGFPFCLDFALWFAQVHPALGFGSVFNTMGLPGSSGF